MNCRQDEHGFALFDWFNLIHMWKALKDLVVMVTMYLEVMKNTNDTEKACTELEEALKDCLKVWYLNLIVVIYIEQPECLNQF